MSKIETNGLTLTRAQRRRVIRNARKIDYVSDGDRKLFKRFPNRTFRLRLSAQVEIEQNGEAAGGLPPTPPPGFRFYMLVCQVAPGVRMKLLSPIRIGSELDDTDLPQDTLAEVYEMVVTRTPQIRDFENFNRMLGDAP